MESVVMIQFGNCYRGRRVLVTGHTGFKGSWLTLWLQSLGAEVVGMALPSETLPNHWNLLGLQIPEHHVDIRKEMSVHDVLGETKPEIVFHLAAQPLVRRSYRKPIETWSTNVMGTANVLEACLKVEGLKAVIVVTSDKCYENREWPWGYRESDALGGKDPYSASKAASEIVAASFRASFCSDGRGPLIATARAGNVIGGGDWSEDRLVPDTIRMVEKGEPVEIRYPNARRPWQFVLESLSGYLRLGQKLLEDGSAYAEAWNFGPNGDSLKSVLDVLTRFRQYWPAVSWRISSQNHPKETTLLQLDSSKALQLLDWRPVCSPEEGVMLTADWYRSYLAGGNVISRLQLEEYIARAKKRGHSWCES